MVDRLSNAIRAHAANLDQAAGQMKFGIVASVNSKTRLARVLLQPEGVLSGWLPILSHWIGSGWGMITPLAPGDQVLVLPQDGDIEQGIIIGATFSSAQPPADAPAGEFWLVHKTGSCLKLCNDGTIRINGDLHVDGDVFDSHGSLAHLRASYNSHRHSSPPNPATGLPTPQD